MVLKQCVQKIHHLSREQKQTRQVSYKKSLLGLFIAFKVLSTSRLNFCTYKIEITNVILGFSYISSSQWI